MKKNWTNETLQKVRLLSLATSWARKHIIHDADKSLISSVSECCLNVLNVHLLLTAKKSHLSKHKAKLRNLAERGAGVRKRKKILVQSGDGLLLALLVFVAALLGRILTIDGTNLKNISHRLELFRFEKRQKTLFRSRQKRERSAWTQRFKRRRKADALSSSAKQISDQQKRGGNRTGRETSQNPFGGTQGKKRGRKIFGNFTSGRRTQKSWTHHSRRESLYAAKLGPKRSIGTSRTSHRRFEFTRNNEPSFRNCREKEVESFEKTDRVGNVRRVSFGYNTNAHTRQTKQTKATKTIRCGLETNLNESLFWRSRTG